ncbi:MAG: undecaprenyldiphospho-muramoylpentapeptide beta-N-acetylglucosaminyltransferase [Spirochaetales bacterium]|nr:undecaprenyldiphospho-muramoylpentapeptide beta-N-acetylglucosaminyltransferase [Spirochaetales bacterium]
MSRKQSKNIKIFFTGGGTGGHVYPGLAVIDSLLEKGICKIDEIGWIGNKHGIEKKIVESRGIAFFSIPAGKLRRYFSLKNFIDIFKVLGGVIKSYFILLRFKPEILFSKGGFVTVPPIFCSKLLKITGITHESDTSLGLATRINSKFASCVMTAYESTAEKVVKRPGLEVVVSGNPVRREILLGDAGKGYEFIGRKPGKKIMLVLGGSLGAVQVNQLIHDNLDQLCQNWFVVHQTGDKNFKEIAHPNYFAAPFFYKELADLYAIADLVVSRAGAGTIWENAICGKPALLIPLGSKNSRGDQVLNAQLFYDNGAADYLLEPSAQEFLEKVDSYVGEDSLLDKMALAAGEFCRRDSSDFIAEYLGSELKGV